MSRNSGSTGRIGIAGYMGAGKSTCAGLLAGPGTIIIDADHEAKLMMADDESIQQRLASAFGTSVVKDASGESGALGKAAFSSVQSMRVLNAIVHPALVKRLHDLVFAASVPCILDAALIPLWGVESWFDRCLWVSAGPSVRHERVRSKTGLPPEAVAVRMSVQEELVKIPAGPRWSFIANEGSLKDLRNRIAEYAP